MRCFRALALCSSHSHHLHKSCFSLASIIIVTWWCCSTLKFFLDSWTELLFISRGGRTLLDPGTKFWKGKWRKYTYPSDNITTPQYNISYVSTASIQKILRNLFPEDIWWDTSSYLVFCCGILSYDQHGLVTRPAKLTMFNKCCTQSQYAMTHWCIQFSQLFQFSSFSSSQTECLSHLYVYPVHSRRCDWYTGMLLDFLLWHA